MPYKDKEKQRKYQKAWDKQKHVKDKTTEISTMIRFLASYDKIDAEIAKCVVLCSNCHRELHAGIIKITNADVTQSAEVSVSKAEC